MTKIIHDLTLQGGMNSDDDPSVFPKEDWRELWEMRAGVSAEGFDGVLESLLSDIYKAYGGSSPTWPEQGDDPVGFGVDEGNQKIYLIIVDNGGSTDYIVEYDIGNDSWDRILKIYHNKGVTNFNKDYPVFEVKVLEGFLYFTDNYTGPKRLDIEKARNWTARGLEDKTVVFWQEGYSYSIGNFVVYKKNLWESTANTNTSEPGVANWTERELLTDIYPSLENRDVDFDARPPQVSPEADYFSDVLRRSNNLRGILFQFAYRYIYVDGRRSVYSPATDTPIPQGELNFDGTYTDQITTNNAINIKVNTGSWQVKRIDVIARSSKDPSSWFKAGSIDIYSDAGNRIYGKDKDIYFKFYNDIVQAAENPDDVNLPFHWVPRLAKDMEIIKDNRFLFTNILEGFDPIELLIEKTLTKTDLSSIDPHLNQMYGPKLVETINEWVTYESKYYFPKGEGSLYVGDKFVIRQYTTVGGWKEASYTMSAGDAATYPTSVKTGLQSAMTAQGMDFHTCIGTEEGNYQVCFWDWTGKTQNGQPIGFWNFMEDKASEGWRERPGELKITPCLKSGANQILGMVYYDENKRSGGVLTSDELRIYLPAYNELGSGDIEMDEVYKLQLTVNHIPPSWAKTWQLVYAPRQSIIWHRNFRIHALSVVDGTTRIDIQTALDNMRNGFERTEIGDYEWQKGDRIRFIARVSGGTPVYPGVLLDFEIEGMDDNDPSRLIVKNFGFSTYYLDNTTIIEIYRPAKDIGEAIYYEIGQEYDVKVDGNGNYYHGGDTDQTVDSQGLNTSGALVTVLAQDCYKWKRFDNNTYYWCEEQSYSDFEQFGNFHSHGFPKAQDPQMRERRLATRFRWGGAYYTETQINDTSVFTFADYENLPEKHGEIQRAILVGFVLKLVMSHKLFSAYIGRTFTLNASGQEELILSNKVIGDIRPNIENWGTQNPESVIVHNRNLYFLDASSAKFLRDSANGLHPISDIKMRNFWQNWIHSNKNTNLVCNCAFNEKYDELWVTVGPNFSSYKTIIFSERRGRWIFQTASWAEKYISVGINTYKINGGLFFAQNDEDDQGYLEYNTGSIAYTGVPRIKLIANQDPWKIKIWQSIAEYATHKWYCPGVGDYFLFTDKNINYAGGTQSSEYGMVGRLLENVIKAKEGILYGPFSRDFNTPGSGNKTLNGRPLRGEWLELNLRTQSDTTDQIRLKRLLIHSIASERSKF